MNVVYSWLALFFLAGSLARGSSLFEDSFDHKENSKIYQHLSNKNKSVEIVPNAGVNGTAGLRVTYAGNKEGSERLVSQIALSESVTEASLSYDVKFESDFQFVKGGKLHGLGPSNPVAGGEAMEPSRWSSRIMFFDHGKVGSYLYHQKKKGQYGDARIADNFKFEKGRFYAITLYTKINSLPESEDGEAWLYIDGKRIAGQSDVKFWKSDLKLAKISTFMFSTFFGGHDSSWAPQDTSGQYKNVHAIFDNFIVESGLKIRLSPGR